MKPKVINPYLTEDDLKKIHLPDDFKAITSFPTPTSDKAPDLSDEEKIAQIEQKFTEILEILGLDLENESLKATPYRIAKMYVKEIFSGLQLKEFPRLLFTDFTPPDKSDSLIFVKNVALNSYCEHHLVPMIGYAHIAYLPEQKIIGLSKINRIAEYFSKRPQLQERLTAQIADSLSLVLESPHVAVYTEMRHFCVQTRGVSDKTSLTNNHFLMGKFKTDPHLRKEFLSQIKRKKSAPPAICS